MTRRAAYAPAFARRVPVRAGVGEVAGAGAVVYALGVCVVLPAAVSGLAIGLLAKSGWAAAAGVLAGGAAGAAYLAWAERHR